MTPTEKAAKGLELIKESVLDYLDQRPKGASHAEIVRDLALESDYEGKQRNYLSWSVVGLLLGENRVRHQRRGNAKCYFKV
jgi:hypothetical protein